MENEESRGLFYKKAFEDELVPFVFLVFGVLIILSLSHSLTHKVFLEKFNIVARRRKESKGRTRKERK